MIREGSLSFNRFCIEIGSMSIRKVQTNADPHEQIVKLSFLSNQAIIILSLPSLPFPFTAPQEKLSSSSKVVSSLSLSLLLVFLLVSILVHVTTNGNQNQMERGQAIAFYVAISCIAFIVSKIFIALLLYKRWKRRHMIYEDGISGGKMVMFKSPATKLLKSDAFLKKTLKLNNKDIIGSGGHGIVYKLALSDSMTYAVKRLNRGSAERDQGFERELDAMGDIKHRNIVTLHGYYTAPHYNLLIYELMPNGSLYAYLHGRSNEKILDWPSRYKIAVGAARGISYLHHDCIPHIIHRDIKSSNILLDQNMDARISDFGLATLMEPDKTHVSTVVAGTFGYLAPEYFETGRATAKGDVYSFGVVLLELLTGKKPTDEAFFEEGTKLVMWVKTVVQEKREEYVLDSSLGCCPVDEVNAVFSIALKCLEPEPAQRPTMAQVVKMLEQIKSNSIVTDS